VQKIEFYPPASAKQRLITFPAATGEKFFEVIKRNCDVLCCVPACKYTKIDPRLRSARKKDAQLFLERALLPGSNNKYLFFISFFYLPQVKFIKRAGTNTP